MPHMKDLATVPAILAALSLTAAPAHAVEMPTVPVKPVQSLAIPALDIEAAQTAEHRRYHRYRYRRGPGLGDVIAGVLIIGAIAHVAKSATRDDRRYPDRDYREDVDWDDSRGIDRAVQMCVEAVERERRVETVDRVDRNARGWQVEGTIFNGDGFSCFIDENGRIDGIDFGRGGTSYEDGARDYEGASYEDTYEGDEYGYEDDGYGSDSRPVDDRQWDDDRYASEWSRVEGDGQAPDPSSQPAYPGGPVEGDTSAEGELEIGTGYPGAGA